MEDVRAQKRITDFLTTRPLKKNPIRSMSENMEELRKSRKRAASSAKRKLIIENSKNSKKETLVKNKGTDVSVGKGFTSNIKSNQIAISSDLKSLKNLMMEAWNDIISRFDSNLVPEEDKDIVNKMMSIVKDFETDRLKKFDKEFDFVASGMSIMYETSRRLREKLHKHQTQIEKLIEESRALNPTSLRKEGVVSPVKPI